MEKNNYHTKNTANTIKEILIIVMAIAFTTAIIMFLTEEGTNNIPREFQKIPLESFFAFICVVTAIIRFYHGNINYMSSTYNVPDHIATNRKYNYRLGIDFIFLFIQAFLFCCLAVYQNRALEFYSIFVVLFLVDAIWFFIIFSFSKVTTKGKYIKSEENASMNWMVTNFVTAIGLILILTGWTVDMSQKIPLIFIIIMLNTVIDYGLNWNLLYFPKEIVGKATAFVGARFTTALQEKGKFNENLKKKIEAVHNALREVGIQFFSSHLIEDFGKRKVNPEDFVERDISDISRCKTFILLLDRHMSAGAFTELGWASLLGKHIIILIPQDCEIENNFPVIRGMHKIAKTKIIEYNSDNINDLKNKLKETIKEE